MKRDVDLIRRILLQTEEFPYPNQYVTFKTEGCTDEEISYHLHLLREGNLLEALDNPYSCFVEWNQVRLTWEGHEFLELARNEECWNEAKKIATEKMEGINFEILKAILLRLNQPTLL